jgi:hypothetical protein
MNGKNLLITLVMTNLLTIGGIAFAGGGMGGGMGGGHGMMGEQGQGMMGYGSNFSNPWGAQTRPNPSYQNHQEETQMLREEIRAKRRELSDLYRAEKPNKEMIDQKIEELSSLEGKLDQELSGR